MKMRHNQQDNGMSHFCFPPEEFDDRRTTRLLTIPEVNNRELYSRWELTSQGIVVDFYATWCMPCLRMEKQIEDFASKNPNVNRFTNTMLIMVLTFGMKLSEKFIYVRSIPFIVLYQRWRGRCFQGWLQIFRGITKNT